MLAMMMGGMEAHNETGQCMRDSRREGSGSTVYAAMTKKTYAGVCEGFDYFSPTGSWQQHS